MKIGFPFIVVKGACHRHAVPFHKFRSKIFQQRVMIIIRKKWIWRLQQIL